MGEIAHILGATDEGLRQIDICRSNNRLKDVPFKRNLDERNSKEEGASILKDQLYRTSGRW